jgi:hypothetical protein
MEKIEKITGREFLIKDYLLTQEQKDEKKQKKNDDINKAAQKAAEEFRKIINETYKQVDTHIKSKDGIMKVLIPNGAIYVNDGAYITDTIETDDIENVMTI